MKKTLIISIMVMAIALCSAQEFNSFRYLSTSGALEGDVEYALDPLQLHYLSGTRFFSDLSNVSGNDKILMNSGDNYLLLGVATDKTFLKKVKAALLFKYYDNEDPLEINCYPSPYDDYPTTDWGRVEYTWQNYFDTNNNSLYDYYEYLYQKYENIAKDKGTDFSLVLSHSLGEKSVLGYKLAYLCSTESNTSAQDDILTFLAGAPTGEYIYNSYNLPEMDPTVEEDTYSNKIIGDFNTDNNESTLCNQIGYMRQGKTWDLSGTYTLDYVDNSLKTNDFSSKLSLDNAVITENTIASRKNSYQEEGLYNQIEGRIRYNLVPDDNPFHTGFISGGLNLGLNTLNVEQNESYIEDSDNPTYAYHTIKSEILSTSGDLTGINFAANTRLNYPLNHKTFIGTGFFYNLKNDNLKGNFSYDVSYVDSTFNNNGSWNYTYSRTSKSKGKIEQEETVTVFRVPVGIEYWFTNNMKWAMRFGSLFTHTVEIYKECYTPTLIEPTLVQFHFPDGTVNTELEENISLKESHSSKYVTSKTDFSYGICFKANDNLQIELLTMFDNEDITLWNTDFFRNLKLSFTIFFK
ncbi:MAG TPA: hypothetical protein P5542_05685 [Candidatus Syntrophosphaera sp.]|nr:hypothetical protein [Candidatus Syntrophosphaera sp.]